MNKNKGKNITQQLQVHQQQQLPVQFQLILFPKKWNEKKGRKCRKKNNNEINTIIHVNINELLISSSVHAIKNLGKIEFYNESLQSRTVKMLHKLHGIMVKVLFEISYLKHVHHGFVVQ